MDALPGVPNLRKNPFSADSHCLLHGQQRLCMKDRLYMPTHDNFVCLYSIYGLPLNQFGTFGLQTITCLPTNNRKCADVNDAGYVILGLNVVQSLCAEMWLSSISSPVFWLRESPRSLRAKSSPSCRQVRKHYTDQQFGRVVFLFLFGVINIILFTVHAYKHRSENGYIIVARGCGMCLNFNCAFIVIFVLR